MENNKYLCPECGEIMNETYDKPALNLICPKCGNKIATTRWDPIDLDSTVYEITVLKGNAESTENVKLVSKIMGENYIKSKMLLSTGFLCFKGNAVEVQNKKKILDDNNIKYIINPKYPY